MVIFLVIFKNCIFCPKNVLYFCNEHFLCSAFPKNACTIFLNAIYLICKLKLMSVQGFIIKREIGAIPMRSRRCK